MDETTEYTQAFTALVKRHEKIIFSVSFFYATADVPFEDLRQEILMSLYKGYSSFKGNSTEATWVYRVSINTCLFSLKRYTPRFRTVPIDEIHALNSGEDSDIEFRHKLQWLYNAIAGLNPMEKALIIMWLDELTYEEIAANMGIPRNTVASRLHRIKEKLSSKKEI